jgi:hypothetical protein
VVRKNPPPGVQYPPHMQTDPPPTGHTLPARVISPVMAAVAGTGAPVNTEYRAATMATPADGPSLDTAPAGKCTCTSRPDRTWEGKPSWKVMGEGKPSWKVTGEGKPSWKVTGEEGKGVCIQAVRGLSHAH